MIIPSIQEIRDLDQATIKNEPISSIDLMERASRRFCDAFLKRNIRPSSILVFCGPGNNGGDGLAVARILNETGLNVDISIIHPENGSDDFKMNLERLPKSIEVFKIEDPGDLDDLGKYACIMDGIFGSGLNRAASALFADCIFWINRSEAEVISIDIPSGMFGDKANEPADPIINADLTYSFQFQKPSFMMPYQGSYTGQVEVLPIGILPQEIGKLKLSREFFMKEEAALLHQKRKKFSHKGSFGHGLLIAGSLGKMGAAALSGKAALRSGLGLLSIHTAKTGVAILQESLNEAMISIDKGENYIQGFPDLEKYDAIGIGPGLDTQELTSSFFKEFLKEIKVPLVLDADALNILSEEPELLKSLPRRSILTPHPGEFKRLVGEWDNDHERLEKQLAFSRDYDCIVILKGANTSISRSDGFVSFNSTGNPGMATAGSGDVLTGIILGLLCQRYSPWDAARLGVYLHGLAGDIKVMEKGLEGLIASDIIEGLSPAFRSLY